MYFIYNEPLYRQIQRIPRQPIHARIGIKGTRIAGSQTASLARLSRCTTTECHTSKYDGDSINKYGIETPCCRTNRFLNSVILDTFYLKRV